MSKDSFCKRHSLLLFLAVPLGILAGSLSASAQTLTVGALGSQSGSLGSGAPITYIDFDSPATSDGLVTIATVPWTAAPCPAALKVKFFRPNGPMVDFVTERGPFDIQSTAQHFQLLPPVAVKKGDVIGVAVLTSCGTAFGHTPARGSYGYYSFSGDLETGFAVTIRPPNGIDIVAQASDEPSLVLLNNRFRVSLSATNPRSSETILGTPVSQADKFGYFSFPEFTGDTTFPEVIVKMVDATHSAPPFGGAFWVFYSSLTDIQYTLTVVDQVTGDSTLYAASSAGGFCGGADTNAFRP